LLGSLLHRFRSDIDINMQSIQALPLFIVGAAAHGMLIHPLSINPANADYDLWDYNVTKNADYSGFNWFTTQTRPRGLTDKTPWDYPGETNIVGSCGVYTRSYPLDQNCGATGLEDEGAWDKIPTSSDATHGEKCDARVYLSKFGGSPVVQMWQAGSTQEVAYTTYANHHGGVGYRLCSLEKVGKDIGKDGPTEQCFQAGHLKFATQETCLRCRDGRQHSCYEAPTKVDGRGNEWREDVLEDCVLNIDFCQEGEDWRDPCSQTGRPFVSHVNMVEVPSDLEPGKYALSWRWDCAETAQVWMNCAEIHITAPDASSFV